MRYHVEYFDKKPESEVVPFSSVVKGGDEQRIGGHVVEADDMENALKKAAVNIECVLRPSQYKVTITKLES